MAFGGVPRVDFLKGGGIPPGHDDRLRLGEFTVGATTIRFQSLIDAAGRPETHLLLTDPARDVELQRAVKANRVLTIHQSTVGTKADYGTIGFDKGAQGQVLIFPKSLSKFEGRRIVGIHYELYEEAPAKAKRSSVPQDRTGVAKGNRRSTKAGRKRPKPEPRARPAKGNIVAFPIERAAKAPEHQKPRTADVSAAVKRKVRQALKALEEGKQVAAYELLKTLVE